MTPTSEPTRLALIADDRVADAARPILLALATRWTRIAQRSLRSHVPGRWQLDVVGAEIIDGSTAKDELRGGYVSATSTELVVAVQGEVVDVCAAHRIGASIEAAATPAGSSQKPTSATALRLFEHAGRAIVESWTAAWREAFDKACAPTGDLSVVSRLIDARTVVRVAMTLSGSVSGRICCYSRPEALIARPVELAAIKANAARIANALCNVPVELVAELGTLSLPLSALRRLDSTTTHTLPQFLDSHVPVFCGGVLKAWAKPVVCRGVLAIQIVSIVHDQGSKS
nr:FliM/FliN family flagellar motor C-terminal domain-containing protein [Kofleriaceae bacterium]